MKSNDFLICILIVTSLLLISVLVENTNKDYDDLRKEYNSLIQSSDGRRCSLCNISYRTNGVYINNNTRVWVESRAEKYINKTDYHESCHLLADKDYNHFCVEYSAKHKLNLLS